jgi:hypothetical protein
MAGFIIEIDTDGLDDGILTYNPNFSYGGDTTTASQSVTVAAYGTTGGDSIFGGDGVNQVDTYVYQYSPDSQPDNLVLPAGQALGGGNVATGLAGGGAGLYSVYATWPGTGNVNGGLTNYQISTTGDNVLVQIDQNSYGTPGSEEWVHLGNIDYTSGPITVTQTSSSNTFVSMRSYGVLFEATNIPEPGSAWLLLGAVPFVLRRRRRQA